MVCINICFAPWIIKKKRKTEHARRLCTPGSGSPVWTLSEKLLHLDREQTNAALCVRAHTVCPEYHCWVLVHVCVCAVGVGGPTVSSAGPHVQVWTMSTKVNFGTRDTADVPPFLWLLLYIPFFWMCKPVHVAWKFLLMCIKRMEQRQKMLLFKLLSLLLLLLLSSFVKLLIHPAYLSRPFLPPSLKKDKCDGEMRFWINYF